MLCQVMLCCAKLCNVVPSYAVLCQVVLLGAMLCQVVLCCAQRMFLEAWHSMCDPNSINENIQIPNMYTILANP